MKSTLLKNLVENLDTNNYVPILYLLVAKTKDFTSERLRHKFEDLPKAFLDLQEHPSIRNWKRLVRCDYIYQSSKLEKMDEFFY